MCNGVNAIAHARFRFQPNLTELSLAESDLICIVRKYVLHDLRMARGIQFGLYVIPSF
jgi:hypothetical protein